MSVVLPDAPLMSWVEETIGSFHVVSQFAHDHGYSQLWRLQTTPGDSTSREFFWLKCHQYPGKWAGEIHALRHWPPALNLAAPRIRAQREEPLAVLLTEIPGVIADAAVLEPEAEQALWQAAGLYLARLHTIENDWLGAANPDGTPQGETHYDPEGFVRRGIESRLSGGIDKDLFDAAEQKFIAYKANEWTAALADETPRAIHRDYSPRNWLTDTNGQLTGVIDFEHARWDVRAADLNRWWDTDFITKPHLADAFFDGYRGSMPDKKLWSQIQALRLLGAAGGIVWATRVGDIPFARTNRDALHRLMEENKPVYY